MPKFIVLLLTFLPALAHADWQYTKWGMTPQEVIDASGGIAVPDPQSQGHSIKDDISLLTGPYQIDSVNAGRFEFSAYFLFDKQTRTLSRVSLRLKNPEQCNSLARELNDKYGTPRVVGGLAALWTDESSNNRIQFLQIGKVDCSVLYTRLKGPVNKGL